MKKKKIIRFSIVISIFLIIFGIVFLTNNLSRNDFHYQEPKQEIIPYEMKTVNEYSYFFSIVNVLNNYLNYLKDQNTEVLYHILHSEYLYLYNINENNIYDNLGSFTSSLQLSFNAKIMAYKTYNDRYLYYVKGDIISNNFEDNEIVVKDAMFLVNVDYENTTYSIYPLDKIYENLPIKNPEKIIELNSYNSLIGSNIITKDYICNLYLNDFINKINDNVGDTYSLLTEEFQRNVYPKKNDYIEYMNNNKDKLNSQVFSCNQLSEQKHIYEVKDMNFNSYIFTEESVMNYKVEFTLE